MTWSHALLILFGFTWHLSAIQEMSQFYPTPIATKKDCQDFIMQKKFSVVKAKAFYKDDEFYLDIDYKFPMKSCLNMMGAMAIRPSFLFSIENIPAFNKRHIQIISDLAFEVDTDVELIPQVKYFLGPLGKRNEIQKGVVLFETTVALAAAERESALSYNDQFFKDLNRTLSIRRSQSKWLVLNGWHLKNMGNTLPPTLFLRETSQIFTGIIIWVDPRNAFKIGRNEVRKFLNGTYVKVIFDMPGSPEVNQANPRLSTAGSMGLSLVNCWLLYRTFFN